MRWLTFSQIPLLLVLLVMIFLILLLVSNFLMLFLLVLASPLLFVVLASSLFVLLLLLFTLPSLFVLFCGSGFWKVGGVQRASPQPTLPCFVFVMFGLFCLFWSIFLWLAFGNGLPCMFESCLLVLSCCLAVVLCSNQRHTPLMFCFCFLALLDGLF